MFEHFLSNYAAEWLRKKWTKSKSNRLPGVQLIDIETEEFLHTKCRVDFFTWLLWACSTRGTSANRQLFYMTVLMQFRGLSRLGMQLVSCFKLTLAPSTFDRFKDEELRFIDMQLRFHLFVFVFVCHLIMSLSNNIIGS